MIHILASAVGLLVAGLQPALAHHPAIDILDEELWLAIDENVADTPHADLVFDDMGDDVVDDMGNVVDSGATEATITTQTPADMQDLIDTDIDVPLDTGLTLLTTRLALDTVHTDGLIEALGLLPGRVTVEIGMTRKGFTRMVITNIQ